MSAPAGAASGFAHALSAGRYAAFVWPAYAVTVLGFTWMIIDTLARARRWRRKTETLENEPLERTRAPR